MSVTNTFTDASGKAFDSSTIIKGLVKVWATDDIVTLINGPVSAEAIADNDGNIVKYRYFAMSFSGIVDRKTLVEQDRTGKVVGAKVVGEEITVDIDDERSTEPVYIDNWDANKLENRLDLKGAKNGEYAILSKEERATRYFEGLRLAVKAAVVAAPGDGVDRQIDTTALDFTKAEDQKTLVLALQKAGDQLASQKNSRRKGTPKASIAYALTPFHVTAIANTQAFTGSNIAGQTLADGSVARLNGIDIYETINSKPENGAEGISYATIRGAVVVPIANPEIVEYPSKSNSWMGAFEYALPKQDSIGVLYGEGIVAIGLKADMEL